MGRARRLIKSIARYNMDNLPVYLSAPHKDITKFKIFSDHFNTIS